MTTMRKSLNISIQNDGPLIQSEVKQHIPIQDTYWRWIALALACTMGFGSHMAYDYPSYLKTQIKERLNIDNKEFGLLYTFYSIPNCILPFFGGFLLDKFGTREASIYFALFLIAGQTICSFSLFFGSASYYFMLFGRVVFAVGADNMASAQSTSINKWFVGKETALAFGSLLSFGKLGSALAGIVLPATYNLFGDNIFAALIFAAMCCCLSLITTILLGRLDKTMLNQDKQIQFELRNQQIQSSQSQNSGLNESYNQFKTDNTDIDKIKQNEIEVGGEHRVRLTDFKKFEKLYWFLCVTCVFNYICLFVFLQQGQDFLIDRYSLTKDQASFLLSIPYWSSACLTPFLGFFIDKIGYRAYIILFASCIAFVDQLFWVILPQCPNSPGCNPFYYYFPLILLGFFYSLYAAVLWPCIPIVLEKKQVGTGFGIAFSVQNIGLAIAPLVVGAIQDSTKEYRNGFLYPQYFYMACATVSIISAVVIIIQDRRTGSRLNKVYKL